MSTGVRVAFAAAAIFLFVVAAVVAFFSSNGDWRTVVIYLGLICLTFVVLPNPTGRS
jgi:hypothetical protein